MGENWKPVIGLSGIYEVSDMGRIRRLKAAKGAIVGRIIRPGLDTKGYPTVALMNEGKIVLRQRVHRIVAEAFLPPSAGCSEIDHINGIRTDNRLGNLERVTHRENLIRARILHSWKSSRHGNPKLTEQQVRIIFGSPLSAKVLAFRYGITREAIYQIRNGVTWRHITHQATRP